METKLIKLIVPWDFKEPLPEAPWEWVDASGLDDHIEGVRVFINGSPKKLNQSGGDTRVDLLDKYSEFVKSTESGSVRRMDHNTRLLYFALGLCGEAGEAAEKIKKLVRDHNGIPGSPAHIEAIAKELGDVPWYLAQLCAEVSSQSNRVVNGKRFGMTDLIQGNIDKLSSRVNRGTIQGEGDDR